MPFAIRLVDVIDDGRVQQFVKIRNPWHGYWLHAYDPDAHEGFGDATFAADVDGALRFDTFDDARACWNQQSSVLPERDGRENRPLTLCSISIDEVA